MFGHDFLVDIHSAVFLSQVLHRSQCTFSALQSLMFHARGLAPDPWYSTTFHFLTSRMWNGFAFFFQMLYVEKINESKQYPKYYQLLQSAITRKLGVQEISLVTHTIATELTAWGCVAEPAKLIALEYQVFSLSIWFFTFGKLVTSSSHSGSSSEYT